MSEKPHFCLKKDFKKIVLKKTGKNPVKNRENGKEKNYFRIRRLKSISQKLNKWTIWSKIDKKKKKKVISKSRLAS